MQLTTIQNKIYEVRGQSVMLDFDLAELYETETRLLKRAVRRNINRFPDDFMFQLTREESKVIPNWDKLPARFSPVTPFAFTEHGVLMLSSVLNSEKAVQTNIQIMRVFVQIRQLAMNYKDLSDKLKEMETKYEQNFNDIYHAINYLLEKDNQETEQKERKKIGY